VVSVETSAKLVYKDRYQEKIDTGKSCHSFKLLSTEVERDGKNEICCRDN